MIKRRGYIIWPIYFDSSASRSICRRVPLRLAVKNPTAEKIASAAKKLGWKVVVEEGSHPAAWWQKTGRVMVEPDKPMKKSEVIKLIASKLKEMKR